MGGMLASNSSPTLALAESQSQQNQNATAQATKPKKKICCACPDTKKLRDECIVEHGEAACAKWIEAHRKCLRAEGFKLQIRAWRQESGVVNGAGTLVLGVSPFLCNGYSLRSYDGFVITTW